ncbi:MAG TPA: MYXO-CTERM sorting domain-containing protein [Polyangiaceae bacterium]
MGWKLALVVGFTPAAAWAQECRVDADCGHGFRCLQTSASTSSVVTGSGGSSSAQVECGDGICEGGAEDPDSCPADCDTISYCAPAECDSNADCAEGYVCGEEVGANSSSTSGGGSSASVCGDDSCDIDENNDNCPEDCPVFRYCQPALTQCSSDAECAEGFYCYIGSGTNDVGSVSVSSVDSGTNGTDTATDGSSSGSSDSDSESGTDGADSGFVPPADDTTGGTGGGDETGVCLVESSDAGSSSGNSGSSNDTTSGPTDSSATGADSGSSAANNNGAGGANAVGGEGSPSSGSGSDGDTGSDGNGTGNNATGSDGGGAGGSDPDAGGGDGDGDGDDGGCSCAVVGVPASSGLLGALLLGMVAGFRRRRTRS